MHGSASQFESWLLETPTMTQQIELKRVLIINVPPVGASLADHSPIFFHTALVHAIHCKQVDPKDLDEPTANAQSASRIQLIRFMLQAGADPNGHELRGIHPWNPLGEAIAQDFHEIIPLLIEHGCDVNEYCLGWHPLLDAAKKGSTNCFKALIHANVKIIEASVYNYRCPPKTLPMNRAAQEYHYTTVLHVIAQAWSGPVGLRRLPGCVLECDQLYMIRTILKHSPVSFVHFLDADGKTALDIASENGNVSSYEVMHSWFFFHHVLQSIGFSISYNLPCLVYSKVLGYLWQG
jgi:ankyrin repeat protein